MFVRHANVVAKVPSRSVSRYMQWHSSGIPVDMEVRGLRTCTHLPLPGAVLPVTDHTPHTAEGMTMYVMCMHTCMHEVSSMYEIFSRSSMEMGTHLS